MELALNVSYAMKNEWISYHCMLDKNSANIAFRLYFLKLIIIKQQYDETTSNNNKHLHQFKIWYILDWIYATY